MFLKRYMMHNYTTAISSVKQISRDYENAIETLNSLQSNADYLKKVRNTNYYESTAYENTILKVEEYLKRIDITLDKLDTLSVIHVAGTKGKGSTCAFCESILRHHGYKTGFFSSPHLVTVRERIRINGIPLETNVFAKYFWNVFDNLHLKRTHTDDMPLYFRFLTLMAFKVFLDEKVDVAIVEVGIGGTYDCTNVLRKVQVVGITPLGLDHTNILGNSIESIAKNKSGIIKKGSRVFTVPQPEAAMKILRQRSEQKQCTLQVVSNFDHYQIRDKTVPENILNMNANLAVALTEGWMGSKTTDKISPVIIENALSNWVWPGRYQIISKENINYYLDGAHTQESIRICVEWFKKMNKNRHIKKSLIFNATGDRNSQNLLSELKACTFSNIYFVPNVATQKYTIDNINNNITVSQQIVRCEKHRSMWLEMEKNSNVDQVLVLPTVSDALQHMSLNGGEYDCLITGSLHLVGAALSIIEN